MWRQFDDPDDFWWQPFDDPFYNLSIPLWWPFWRLWQPTWWLHDRPQITAVGSSHACKQVTNSTTQWQLWQLTTLTDEPTILLWWPLSTSNEFSDNPWWLKWRPVDDRQNLLTTSNNSFWRYLSPKSKIACLAGYKRVQTWNSLFNAEEVFIKIFTNIKSVALCKNYIKLPNINIYRSPPAPTRSLLPLSPTYPPLRQKRKTNNY